MSHLSKTILLSGIPCSGKSYFGSWLEQQKGYVHIDVEAKNALDRWKLRDPWERMFTSDPAMTSPVLEAIHRLGTQVVINWGFPPRWLPVVKALIIGGCDHWWFDGDWEAARRCYIQRGGDLQHFEKQKASIQEARLQIDKVFSGRLLVTLNSSGIHMTPDDIFHRMFMHSKVNDLFSRTEVRPDDG